MRERFHQRDKYALIGSRTDIHPPLLRRYYSCDAADASRTCHYHPPVLFEGFEKYYLEPSCCTISNDFSTCASGVRLSSFDEKVAMILWSLPMTKVVRSIKS
jgi:hypothetical protein